MKKLNNVLTSPYIRSAFKNFYFDKRNLLQYTPDYSNRFIANFDYSNRFSKPV